MNQLVRSREIMEMCEILAAQENLQVTVRESFKCGAMTGFGAIAGGLLGGPVGIAIGGSFASIVSAWLSKNKFRSVIDILKNDLTPSQQKKLIENMSKVLTNIKSEDWLQLGTFVLTSASLKEVVLKELLAFLYKEMNLSIA